MTEERRQQVCLWCGRQIRRWALLLLLIVGLLLGLRSSIVLPNPSPATVDEFADEYRFDVIVWEFQALLQKAISNLRYPSPGLAGLEGSLHVQCYIELSYEASELEQEIEAAYAALPLDTPATGEIVELEADLRQLQSRQREMQPMVETIIERQVSRTVYRQGLTTAGVVWPPVLFRLEAPPLFLIVSPRDQIELMESDHLRPHLSLTDRVQLEDSIDGTLDVSSLVENLGGYGTYPPLVREYASLVWLTNTVAHEWTHNYLEFHPLGRSYSGTPGMRTVNETIASLMGDELGAQVLESYYPWIPPPPLTWQKVESEESETVEPAAEPEESQFDFGEFMRETRLEADRLLAAGDMEEAESYMEERRQELVEEGYVIRKLNQAYFAFHGLYAIRPGAVDPTGSKVEDLRRRSPSLRDFLLTVQAFRTPADLDAALIR